MGEPVSATLAGLALSSAGAITLAIIKNNPGCINKILACGTQHRLRGVLVPSKSGKSTLINNLNVQSSKYHFIDVESESRVFLQNQLGPAVLELKQKQDWNAIKNVMLQNVPNWIDKLKPLKGKKLVLVASNLDLLDACGCNCIWALCPSQNLVKQLSEKLTDNEKAELMNSVSELYKATDQNKVIVYDSWQELANVFKALFGVQLKF